MSLWQGKRQKARGKRQKGLGDFTFLYTVWFYCVHLLKFDNHENKISQLFSCAGGFMWRIYNYSNYSH
ncbi:MAG: hypothetical protein HEQ13_06165 [Dolichospermum sp. DEX189]|nr:hypothetical protein [Dolichospermum sp. DEX189]